MLIKEVMTNRVRAVAADSTVRQTAAEMAAINVGALPVARGQKLVGMITDRDIAVRLVGEGLDAEATTAEQIMSPDVFTVAAEQDIIDAARAMRDRQVRRAPVIDNDQRLVGIVSLGDIAAKGKDLGLSGEVLEGISQPAAPNLQ